MSTPRVVDVAVRCMRTNPELVAFASRHAPRCGRSVDDLLAAAARRMPPVPAPAGAASPPRLEVLRCG